jgi:hypothetical protein
MSTLIIPYPMSLNQGDSMLGKPSKSLSGSLSKSKTTSTRTGTIPKLHLKSIKALAGNAGLMGR